MRRQRYRRPKHRLAVVGSPLSIPNYSVLKAHPVAGKVVSGTSAHYQITVDVHDKAHQPFTAALNIQSVDGSEVLFAIESAFIPPDPLGLASLKPGITPLQSKPGGLALDFVREQVGGKPMITRDQMTLLPVAENTAQFLHPAGRIYTSDRERRAHALQNAVAVLLGQAIADPTSELYVFGSAFADGGVVDGIHDVHMNQGNPASSHSNENGVWQDGALFINSPLKQTWTALFLAFQTESWHTDGQGSPIP